jgi:hypothetical protein
MKSGVINEYVDSTKLELRFLENVNAGLGIRDIHRKNLDTGIVAQFCGNRFQVSSIASDQHQVRASVSKFACRGRTDALGPTGDNHRLVFEDH